MKFTPKERDLVIYALQFLSSNLNSETYEDLGANSSEEEEALDEKLQELEEKIIREL